MKNLLIKFITLMLVVSTALFIGTACKQEGGDNNATHVHEFKNYVSDNNATYDADGTKTAKCEHVGCNETDTIVDVGSKLEATGLTFKTLTVNELNVSGKVSNATTKFNFNNEIITNENYIVALNSNGTNQVLTKEVDLVAGDNVVYVFLMKGYNIDKIYTVTIRRLPTYLVSFATGIDGVTVPSQTIEEGSLATKPNNLEKAGYTFNGYDFNFNTPITSNLTINALWTANGNTPYKVEYYLENIEDNNYAKVETVNKQGVTDTTAYAEIKTFEHFTAESQSVSGNINGNGTTVLKVYYGRNEYSVTFDGNGGSVTGAGKYKYGKQVTLTATASNLGCESFGWYNGNTLLSSSLEYKVAIDKDIIAKYTVKAEMVNFNFTSTATTCEITSVKDKSVTEIVVPSYVTSISSGAFSGCSKLQSITLPFVGAKAGVTSSDTYQYPFGYIFGTSSFTGSSATTQNYLDSSTSIIINTTYYIPTSLKEVTVTGGNILLGAFSNCDSLTSVTIGNSVTSIGYRAFYNTGIYKNEDNWENGVLYIGNWLIEAKDTISGAYTIKEGTVGIADNAFYNCNSLTSIEIPNSVTSIGSGAFGWCDSLTSIEIPNSVTSIGSSAFYYCTSLTSIEIPNSVTSIGEYAFNNCYSLTKVNYTGSLDDWAQIEFANSYSNPLCYAKNLYINNELVTNAVISTATKINAYAFYDCNSLTSIEIPNSVTSIGYEAFVSCDSLTNVTIGNSVTSIGSSAFYSCYSLTNVTIGNSVTSIGNYAFYNCYSLTSITFSDTSTWYRTNYTSDFENKTNGAETDVTSATNNATYFISTYKDYYWYKK